MGRAIKIAVRALDESCERLGAIIAVELEQSREHAVGGHSE
jgi:hypothetical protein